MWPAPCSHVSTALTLIQQALWYWSWSVGPPPAIPLLPMHLNPANCFGLLRSQSSIKTGRHLVEDSLSPPSELTLSALWLNACSTTSQNDCFYQLTPSKIVHCWLRCTKFQILVPFYLLSRLWIFNSGIWSSSSAAERSSFAFTTPRNRALSEYHRITAKQQSSYVHPESGLWLRVCHFHFLTDRSGKKKCFSASNGRNCTNTSQAPGFPIEEQWISESIFMWALAYLSYHH